MPCGLTTWPSSIGSNLLGVGLHHVERAGIAALAADVDEDQGVVAAHHLVGEVEPAGAEVEHAHPVRQLASVEALGDRPPKPSSFIQALPMPATRICLPALDPRAHRPSTSSGKKNR